MTKLALSLIAAVALTASPLTTDAAQFAGDDITVEVDKDGSTFTVSAELTVAAEPDEVWSVLTDFDHMAQILSNVDASRIANRDGNKFDVIQKSHASAGLLHISLDSVRRIELSPKQEIHSRLLNGDLKSSDFTTRVVEDGNVVKITVHGTFVVAGLMGAAITPETVEAQTRQQYKELREEILRRKTKQPPPPCLLAKNCTPAST